MSDLDRRRPFTRRINRYFWKSSLLAVAALLCLCMLPGCGGPEKDNRNQESRQDGRSEPSGDDIQGSGALHNPDKNVVYDIFSDIELVVGVEDEDVKGALRSVQFFREEPVILSVLFNREDEKQTADIWMYSSGARAQPVVEGLPAAKIRYGEGFVDEEGCYYHLNVDRSRAVTNITKYDHSGKTAYTLEKPTENLHKCSLADGKMALLYTDNVANRMVLELLDTATGAVSEVKLKDTIRFWALVWLGTDGTVPYLLDSDGIYKVDLECGEITEWLTFDGTTYALGMETALDKGNIDSFRIKENGDVTILWGAIPGPAIAEALNVPSGAARLETIQKRALDASKTILTLRGSWEPIQWLKNRITEFNKKSRDYYVLVETADISQTLVELGTGKGPDILYGDHIFGDSLYSLIQKGVFEDLAPYMERSEIRPEDYFNLAFCSYGSEGRVYGINPIANVLSMAVDSSVLGEGNSMEDIGSFLDALLKLGDTAVYETNMDSGEMLQLLLQGSDNLWGMIDWEKGVCRLDEELFAELLQAAKNLGDSDRKSYAPVAARIIFSFNTSLDDSMYAEKTVKGMLFDDGFHGLVQTNASLKINANSPNKEGVWEFLSYLLSREVQETKDREIPVHRGAFATQAKEEIRNEFRYRELSEADVAWLEAWIENARFPSARVQPLIDIIKEGARDYFDGTKDIGQVRDVTENQIQLYLDERP